MPADDQMSTKDRYLRLEREPVLGRRHPAVLCAAVWTTLALSVTRRRLRKGGFSARVPAPLPLPWGSRRGVYGVLARLSPTCLEKAYVQQRWLSSYGLDLDVVVGVRRDESGGIGAHAWIQELTPASAWRPYTVIHRVPAA